MARKKLVLSDPAVELLAPPEGTPPTDPPLQLSPLDHHGQMYGQIAFMFTYSTPLEEPRLKQAFRQLLGHLPVYAGRAELTSEGRVVLVRWEPGQSIECVTATVNLSLSELALSHQDPGAAHVQGGPKRLALQDPVDLGVFESLPQEFLGRPLLQLYLCRLPACAAAPQGGSLLAVCIHVSDATQQQQLLLRWGASTLSPMLPCKRQGEEGRCCALMLCLCSLLLARPLLRLAARAGGRAQHAPAARELGGAGARGHTRPLPPRLPRTVSAALTASALGW